MSEYGSDVLRLAGKGYCCSQILFLLALEIQGEENSGLVRAMQGLCEGGGRLDGVCGVLSGGQALLAYYLGKGDFCEKIDNRLPLLQKKYFDWFAQRVSHFGDVTCGSIAPDPSSRFSICPVLIAEGVEQLFSFLMEAGEELDEVKEN